MQVDPFPGVHGSVTRRKRNARTLTTVEVALIRWPEDDERRVRLAQQARPRLLLVGANQGPPVADDVLEDWIRVPAPGSDLRARVEALTRLANQQRASLPLVEDGTLRYGGCVTTLAPIQARLTAALAGRFGAVVSRRDLAEAGWPDGTPQRNGLDVQILRLRKRLAGMGLRIRTVRSRGYVLEPA